MNLSNKIKEARNKLKLTQNEVANQLNISRKTLSSWENERSSPDSDSIKKLASILNVDVTYLLGITPNKNLPKETKHKISFSKILFSLNSVFLAINIIASISITRSLFFITICEVFIMLITLNYFKLKNIKLSIPYKYLSLIISFLVFLFISEYHLELITEYINIYMDLGVIIKTVVLTTCFYLILVHLNNDKNIKFKS